MAVAVPVKDTVTAAEKARLGVAFGVEAHELEAAVRAVGGKGEIVRFGHRMRGGNIKLVLDILNAKVVRLIGLLGFERRQGDAAARDHRAAGRVQHIAAHRAHIQPGAAHVGGAVNVDDLLAGEQLRHGNAQRGRKRLEQRNIRKAAAGLPFGNGLVADADLLGELELGQMLFFAQRADRRAGYIIVHVHSPFRVGFSLCSQHNRNTRKGQPPLRRVAEPERGKQNRERMLFALYNMKVSCYNENNTRGLTAYAEENRLGDNPDFRQ